MVEIDDKIPQYVYFPKTQNTTGIYTLDLHSELSQKDWTFDVTDQANLKDYYKFFVDFSTVDDGEFNYHICAKDSSTELDTGLIRIGVVKNYGNKSYDDDVQIIQYDMYATPEIRYQHKSITVAANGVYNITPDDGYAALSDVDVTVDVECGGCTPEELDAAYQSGWTNGYTSGYTDGQGTDKYLSITGEYFDAMRGYIFEEYPTSHSKVISNTSWLISDFSNWLQISQTAGTGTTNITITPIKNTVGWSAVQGGWARSTTIWLMDIPDLGMPVKVEQFTAVDPYNPAPVSVTGITVDNLSWGASNIPATGGTADASDCTFIVTAHNSDNTTTDITSAATVTGSLVVPATTATTVQPVGTLTLTFTYDGYTATASTTVYQDAANVPYTNQYLTFDIISGGTIKWSLNKSSPNHPKTIEYSLNGGEWTSITSTTGGTIINVNAGDKIQFRGNNSQYAHSTTAYSGFKNSTAKFKVEGNIMSLIDSTNFANLTTLESTHTFYSLFFNCTGLTDASNLILPATALTNGCYYSMFDSCTSLTTAPELPATTLAEDCYVRMFIGCTSLTTAPVLPATTLASGCYGYMFERCTNLNYIKCLATDISALNCTVYWLTNVASTGTFVKAAGVNWATGDNGIPANWDVVNN